jgi:hypothetical protein
MKVVSHIFFSPHSSPPLLISPPVIAGLSSLLLSSSSHLLISPPLIAGLSSSQFNLPTPKFPELRMIWYLWY